METIEEELLAEEQDRGFCEIIKYYADIIAKIKGADNDNDS